MALRAVPPGSDEHSNGLEKQMIESALRNSGGSITGAARQIGWTRQKLSRRIKVLSVR
jgi:DNA-binding NtrC family response regulator